MTSSSGAGDSSHLHFELLDLLFLELAPLYLLPLFCRNGESTWKLEMTCGKKTCQPRLPRWEA